MVSLKSLKIKVTNGSLNMNQPHEVNTSGELSFNHPELGSLEGNIQIGGTLTEYKLDTDLDFINDKAGAGSLSIVGDGDYKKIKLSNVNITSEHGTAASSGDIVWDPEIRLRYRYKCTKVKSITPRFSWEHKRYCGSKRRL